MIECKFRTRPEYENYKTHRVKCGRYHGSFFHDVKEFGRKKWVILVEIDTIKKENAVTPENHRLVAEGCVEYLNQFPIRKRKTKKKRIPQYGNLELYKSFYKEDDSGGYIVAYLVTDQKKNKHFWGAGPTGGIRARKKRTA